ncbi:MAG: ATP-binding cassette domain-containing protein [Candidatus Shapirobacteria bacterium]|nr:ATP-binding cassette domain-containing protein [Candidatus Shapirobacteria bacterium]
MKIAFNNVNKSFGAISALKSINFTVKNGEFVFIVGPSGAGKSTLLKLILNQVKASSGEILIDDINLTDTKKNQTDKIRQKIGVIFQDFQLIPDKTIEENIALALDIVTYPQAKIISKIDDVLKRVGLINRRFLFPSQLSGGELQRTSLARALAVEPGLILADEPTGNLDVENSWNLIRLLKEINEKYKTTIIMTTHNQDVIESLNNRTIWLKNGTIVNDTPQKTHNYSEKT